MAAVGTRGDRTRAAILAAAAGELATVGLEGLRGPSVAATAGVSEATVWFHFGTKAGLLVAVMEDYYDDLVDDLAEAVEAAADPRSRLDAFADFWFRRIAADLALVGEFQRHGRSGHDADVVAAFAACNRRVTRQFERLAEDLVATGVFRSDLPTWLARDVFFGTAEHVLVRGAVTGRRSEPGDAAARVCDVLLRGVGTDHDDPGDAPDLRATIAAIDDKLDRLLER